MRSIVRILSTMAMIGFGLAAFTNFAPIDKKTEAPAAVSGAETKKEYIQIHGKLYERNARGVYYIDGVPTYAGHAQKKTVPTTVKSNVGPAIDPTIYKDAMGLDADDEFFKPRSGDATSTN